jgi:hypothetical protein
MKGSLSLSLSLTGQKRPENKKIIKMARTLFSLILSNDSVNSQACGKN